MLSVPLNGINKWLSVWIIPHKEYVKMFEGSFAVTMTERFYQNRMGGDDGG